MKPLVTGLALRDATVRDYAAAARRWGITPDMPAIHRQAESDLVLVDAYNREVARVPAPAKKPAKPRAQRVDELDQALADLNRGNKGARIATPQKRGKRVRDAALYARARQFGKTVWWWPHAIARIKRLLQGARGSTIIVGIGNADAPALAREFMHHWMAMLQRRPWSAPTRSRPYDGMKDVDAERKFVSAVESICERSKALPGLREWRFR